MQKSLIKGNINPMSSINLYLQTFFRVYIGNMLGLFSDYLCKVISIKDNPFDFNILISFLLFMIFKCNSL